MRTLTAQEVAELMARPTRVNSVGNGSYAWHRTPDGKLVKEYHAITTYDVKESVAYLRIPAA